MKDDGTEPTEREEDSNSACPEKGNATASDATGQQSTGGDVAKPREDPKTGGLWARVKRHKKIAVFALTVLTIIGTVIGIADGTSKLFSTETMVPPLHRLHPDEACETLREAELRCEARDFEATNELNVVQYMSKFPRPMRGWKKTRQ